jgi:hypothetical protein
MPEPQQGRQLPVGYWLRRVDELLTEHSNAALSARGFTRLGWQTLNTIAEAGSLSRERLIATLRPFADPDELDALAEGLAESGWIVAEGEGTAFTVTEPGRAVRAELLQLQQAVREQAFAGVSAEEYAALLDILQRVAHNLS